MRQKITLRIICRICLQDGKALPDLLAGRKGSYLEEVDEYNVEVEARQLLSASVLRPVNTKNRRYIQRV